MSTESWSHEIESSVEASRLFKAVMVDWHNLGPKILPDAIASAAPVSGTGAAGSIRQINFTSAMRYPYVKERLDFIDHEGFECKSTLLEGGVIGTKLESLSFHYKIVPAENGGCVVKVVATYVAIAGAEAGSGGEITNAKEGVTRVIKATEAHLIANPTAYA